MLNVIQGAPDSPKRVKKLVSSTILFLNEVQSVKIGGRGVDFSIVPYALFASEELSNEKMVMAELPCKNSRNINHVAMIKNFTRMYYPNKSCKNVIDHFNALIQALKKT